MIHHICCTKCKRKRTYTGECLRETIRQAAEDGWHVKAVGTMCGDCANH